MLLPKSEWFISCKTPVLGHLSLSLLALCCLTWLSINQSMFRLTISTREIAITFWKQKHKVPKQKTGISAGISASLFWFQAHNFQSNGRISAATMYWLNKYVSHASYQHFYHSVCHMFNVSLSCITHYQHHNVTPINKMKKQIQLYKHFAVLSGLGTLMELMCAWAACT